jgi:hypothetical protein
MKVISFKKCADKDVKNVMIQTVVMMSLLSILKLITSILHHIYSFHKKMDFGIL